MKESLHGIFSQAGKDDIPFAVFQTSRSLIATIMKLKTLPNSAILFSLVFLLTSVRAQEKITVDTSGGPVSLKMEWKPGKSYVQRMTMDQNSKMNMLGQEIEQKMKMEMSLSMAVSLLAGTPLKEVKTQYDRVGMDMEMMGQKMHFDSKDGAAAQPGNPFAAMGSLVGKPFTLTLDQKNEIVDIKGMDQLMGDLASNPVSGEMAKQLLGKDQIAQMMNLAIAQALPKDPVSPGQSWDVKIPLSLGQMGSVVVSGKYTYQGMAKIKGTDCAVIAVDSEMKMDLSEGTGDDAVSKMGLKVQGGKQTGYLFWDTKQAWLHSMAMDQNMTLTIKSPGGEGELTVPTTQKTTTEVEIKDN